MDDGLRQCTFVLPQDRLIALGGAGLTHDFAGDPLGYLELATQRTDRLTAPFGA